jgi:hypothetical protein
MHVGSSPSPGSRRRRPLRLLRRFGGLAPGRRRAVVRALVLLVAARIALLALPFPTMLGFAARPHRRAAPARQRRLDDMLWAVEAVGNRLFPRNPCLVQALVVQRLFRSAGLPAELRIGVRRDATAGIAAHAWVESDGAVVIGRKGLDDDFAPFPPLRPGPASSPK